MSNQVYLSLLERSAEYDIVPTALDQGLGLLIWSPLAGGLFLASSGGGHPEPEGSRHSGGWHEPPLDDRERLLTSSSSWPRSEMLMLSAPPALPWHGWSPGPR